MTVLAIVAALASHCACSGSGAGADAKSLADEIARLDKEISAAEEANSARKGGGVFGYGKLEDDLRIATMKQTREMLRQKQDSWTFGIGLTYTVDGRPYVMPQNADRQRAETEEQLARVESQIKEQEAKPRQRSGGLFGNMAADAQAASLDTLRATQVLLEQRRLRLKYALPEYAEPCDEVTER